MNSDHATGTVETSVTKDTVSATGIVDAPPWELFDLVRRPVNHPAIGGDGSVKASRSEGQILTGVGDAFGMSMKIGLPYLIRNTVKEYEEGSRIAWAHPGGHRWRWEFEPTEDGRTRVTETFDLSTALLPFALRIAGYPGGHETNVRRSVENLQSMYAED